MGSPWFKLMLCAGLLLVVFSPHSLWAVKCTSDPSFPRDYIFYIAGQAVVIHIPVGYTDETPTPILFDLHGAHGTGFSEESYSGFRALSDKYCFIGAWPSGPNYYWACLGCFWDSNSVDSDVSQIRLIVDLIRRIANVDRSRIYITGISMGGGMTNTIVCEAADVFAAVAPVAFQLAAPPGMCTPSRPVSLIEFHGYLDTVLSYNGSPGLGLPSAPTSLLMWAQIMGCVGSPEVTLLGDGISKIETYTNCQDGVRVVLASLSGVHDLFGSPPSVLNIPEYTWNFFTQFTLPLTPEQMNECPSELEISALPDWAVALLARGKHGGGNKCFIATAAFGSYLDPHVIVLQNFRDQCLVTNAPGRAFVEFYYNHAPPLAGFLQKHEFLKIAVRWILTAIIYAVKFPYRALMCVILFSGGLAIEMGRRRRRRRSRLA